ncbi:hypothetical protein EI94DRAFT_1698333 [Lactarius quietus]|nr:hypothetical protein EI94DRAFT_1698333 [Lactarius quietus]
MNPPPEIGSRVRWWDARGQIKTGTVKAINVLTDNSHVVVIQVEDEQASTVTLPRMTSERAEWVATRTAWKSEGALSSGGHATPASDPVFRILRVVKSNERRIDTIFDRYEKGKK